MINILVVRHHLINDDNINQFHFHCTDDFMFCTTRRVFLEHMIYYLARTGNSYHFFPEIPPIQWVSHIEALKFRWTSRAHARRKARQLTSLSREEALDLCPLDSEIEHHGEEHFLKLLLKERSTFESLVARLMADYCFLCHPAMPCSTLASLHRLGLTLKFEM